MADHDPRDPREILSLLAVRTPSMLPIPGGFGGLKASDIAAALSTAPRPAVLLAMVKYLDHASDLFPLADAVFRYVGIHHEISPWRIPRRDFLRDMCRLAVCEYVDPHTCLTCGGVKVVTVDADILTCDRCNGTGRRRIYGRDRALAMGMRDNAWRRYWADRYERIYVQLADWDRAVEKALRRHLGMPVERVEHFSGSAGGMAMDRQIVVKS